ncbi:hypothetical protein BT96DRAFT_500934 [Gymnopus androsaceus JB14]|uniref:Uncharacterized protein n=1 Tax=Gymnopus androsaceus JB14 TaxID=1447944 RepID=A0A6A4HZW7_9AGAR|nr:hypothetical protein BT96DRAFT_500934 [Gymnopus androsaceus JB14]
MKRKRLTALGKRSFSRLSGVGSQTTRISNLESTLAQTTMLSTLKSTMKMLKRNTEADDLYLHAKLEQCMVLHTETLYRLLRGRCILFYCAVHIPDISCL